MAVVAAVLALAGLIAVHHSGMATGDTHHEGMSAAVEMCLGVLGGIGAAVVAVAIGLVALGRWRPPLTLSPVRAAPLVAGALVRARAGPELLSLLCVTRR